MTDVWRATHLAHVLGAVEAAMTARPETTLPTLAPRDATAALLEALAMERGAKRRAMARIVELLEENHRLRAIVDKRDAQLAAEK